MDILHVSLFPLTMGFFMAIGVLWLLWTRATSRSEMAPVATVGYHEKGG